MFCSSFTTVIKIQKFEVKNKIIKTCFLVKCAICFYPSKEQETFKRQKAASRALNTWIPTRSNQPKKPILPKWFSTTTMSDPPKPKLPMRTLTFGEGRKNGKCNVVLRTKLLPQFLFTYLWLYEALLPLIFGSTSALRDICGLLWN